MAAACRHTALLAIAKQMRHREYTLRQFLDDCVTNLPELRLYVSTPAPTPSHGEASSASTSSTSSGRAAADEYLRTIGALCALYWLSRLSLPDRDPTSTELDGQCGFCFGVDSQAWQPPSKLVVASLSTAKGRQAVASSLEEETALVEKRLAFLQHTEWEQMHDLLCDAHLLEPDGSGGTRIAVERMAAMLALTAVHDVCKLSHLLPTVLAEHAPYRGYRAGDVLTDHDLALGYVLQHDVEALPCVAALPVPAQAAIRFTQSDLGFNHGWLVQAEAPPGAVFTRFKALLDSGSVEARDIAFYFVHWLTDLAGAVPTPLRGCEKFVVAFPRAVLRTIVHSMPVVQRLATTAPVKLYEEYLHFAWPTTALGPAPRDCDAIATLRLLTQVQDVNRMPTLRAALHLLGKEARASLSLELALTGVAGERYSSRPDAVGGPAFLLYYSPAYLRNCCAVDSLEEALAALTTLQLVYSAARALWPREEGNESSNVTILIDSLQSCLVANVLDAHTHGLCFVLQRTSDVDGKVIKVNLEALPAVLSTNLARVLPLWRSELYPPCVPTEDPPGSVAPTTPSMVGQ